MFARDGFPRGTSPNGGSAIDVSPSHAKQLVPSNIPRIHDVPFFATMLVPPSTNFPVILCPVSDTPCRPRYSPETSSHSRPEKGAENEILFSAPCVFQANQGLWMSEQIAYRIAFFARFGEIEIWISRKNRQKREPALPSRFVCNVFSAYPSVGALVVKCVTSRWLNEAVWRVSCARSV